MIEAKAADEIEQFLQSVGHLLTDAEIAQLRRAGMGRRIGFGRTPALLIIDAQNYMVGPTGPDDDTEYPSACPGAREVLPVIAAMAQAFRDKAYPVIYTRNVARPDGLDMGLKRLKRGLLKIEGWYLEGTRGAEIAPQVAPQANDLVLVKGKQSGFHGTPMLNLLVAAGVDTVVVTGGSTSNCVRATALDASSYNFRTIVPRDAVFDRIRVSHQVNLMDIARQLGDVVTSEEVTDYLAGLKPNSRNLANVIV
jgi:nicotinamidase-related amidase